jgi:hypothetical protein
MGRARSGKDSFAEQLVGAHGYTRLAFADPLKEMALAVNPIVPTGYRVYVRLAPLVADVGWEYAKDTYPEVRRLLQEMGQRVRDLDGAFWVRALLRRAVTVRGPIVVTDVRYPNELHAMRRAGFTVLRIERPGVADMAHESETALGSHLADGIIENTGSLAQLRAHADGLVEFLNA